jgi:hypothetical protein
VGAGVSTGVDTGVGSTVGVGVGLGLGLGLGLAVGDGISLGVGSRVGEATGAPGEAGPAAVSIRNRPRRMLKVSVIPTAPRSAIVGVATVMLGVGLGVCRIAMMRPSSTLVASATTGVHRDRRCDKRPKAIGLLAYARCPA